MYGEWLVGRIRLLPDRKKFFFAIGLNGHRRPEKGNGADGLSCNKFKILNIIGTRQFLLYPRLGDPDKISFRERIGNNTGLQVKEQRHLADNPDTRGKSTQRRTQGHLKNAVELADHHVGMPNTRPPSA
jgi:hypothetical protein